MGASRDHRNPGLAGRQTLRLACNVHERREAFLQVLALRREQHERIASSSTYRALREAADALERLGA